MNPNSPDAHQLYAVFLASRGRFEQAISETRKALELDPLSLLVNINSGFVYWFARRLDEAMALSQKMIRLEPDFFAGYWLTGLILWAQGKYEESIAEYERSVSLTVHQQVLAGLGSIYGTIGKRDEALRVLNQLLEMKKEQNVHAFNIVRVYGGLGEMDTALEWLQKALEERNAGLVFLEQEIEVGSMKSLLEPGVRDAHVLNLLRREGLMS